MPASSASSPARKFVAYQTVAGDRLLMVDAGTVPADKMFAEAVSTNTMITWLLRVVGLVVLFIGFAMLLSWMGVLADVIPFVGSIVSFGTGLIAFLLAILVGAAVIAIAWFWYRPLLVVRDLRRRGAARLRDHLAAQAAVAQSAEPRAAQPSAGPQFGRAAEPAPAPAASQRRRTGVDRQDRLVRKAACGPPLGQASRPAASGRSPVPNSRSDCAPGRARWQARSCVAWLDMAHEDRAQAAQL